MMAAAVLFQEHSHSNLQQNDQRQSDLNSGSYFVPHSFRRIAYEASLHNRLNAKPYPHPQPSTFQPSTHPGETLVSDTYRTFSPAPHGGGCGAHQLDKRPSDLMEPYAPIKSGDASPDGGWTSGTPFMDQDTSSSIGTQSPTPRDDGYDPDIFMLDNYPSWDSNQFPPMTGSAQFNMFGAYPEGACSPKAHTAAPRDIQLHLDEFCNDESPRHADHTTLPNIHRTQDSGEIIRPKLEECAYLSIRKQPERSPVLGERRNASGKVNAAMMENADAEEEDVNEENDSEYYSTMRAMRAAGCRSSQNVAYSRLSKDFLAQPFRPTRVTKRIGKQAPSSPPPPPFPSCPAAPVRPSHTCQKCPKRPTFELQSAFYKHIQAVHVRPFDCIFQEYRCLKNFGNKNEWNRHIRVQHLHPEKWACDMGACRSSASPSHDFDRRDLFTQHVRRQHPPTTALSAANQKQYELEAQRRCHRKLRGPPPRSICTYCPHGPVYENWDIRQGEVAKHLEMGPEKKPSRDCELEKWMIEQGLLEWVAGGWQVVGVGGKRRRQCTIKKVEEYLCDEDAEGEDE